MAGFARPAGSALALAISLCLLLSLVSCQPAPPTGDPNGGAPIPGNDNGAGGPEDQPGPGGGSGDDAMPPGGDDFIPLDIPDTEEALMSAADLDAWVDAVAARPAGWVAPQTLYSTDLIRLAQDEGRITEEQAWVYRAIEVFDHDSLDPQFRAEPTPRSCATPILRQLAARYDGFSVETQAQLRPYMAPFDDPESYWYRAGDVAYPAASETGKVADGVRLMDRPTDTGDFFEISGEPGQDLVVATVREALETSYLAFLDLGFTEPTDWIDVKIRADIGSPTLWGEETFGEMEGHERCSIVIRSDLSDDNLRGTAAHELFHCFQEYVDADPNVAAAEWVWESSAVWSEEFVYPGANTEHRFDRTFFSTLEYHLFDTGGTHEYASYPWWFFIYQRDGKTGNAVRDFYLEIQREGTIEAFGGRPNRYEEFKEYALWNLNTDPHEYYDDFDGEPSLRPHGSSASYRALNHGETVDEPVILQAGGIIYYLYTFDDLVGKVSFDLTDVQKNADNENGIQAVYRIDGEWTYEDVSYRDDLTFCRTRESENVDALILIVSNGLLDDSPSGSLVSEDITIDTTEWCMASWHGYVACSWDNGGEGSGRGDRYLDPGDYTSVGNSRVDETLVLEPGWAFYATDATATLSSRYEWYWEHIPPENVEVVGYTAWERRVEEENATTHYTYDLGEDCPPDCSGPRRIRVEVDGDQTRYFLTPRTFDDMGQYLSVYSSYYVPGSLGLMQGHVAEVRTSEDEHTISMTTPSESFELIMSGDGDGDTLRGTYRDGSYSCEAVYTYD